MFTIFYTNAAGVETSSGPYCGFDETQIAIAELWAAGNRDFRVERDFEDRYTGFVDQ